MNRKNVWKKVSDFCSRIGVVVVIGCAVGITVYVLWGLADENYRNSQYPRPSRESEQRALAWKIYQADNDPITESEKHRWDNSK